MASVLAPISRIWVSADRRRLFEVIPDPMRKVWDKWNVQGSIIASFLCQIIIGILGNRRKHTVSKVTDTLVWGAYVLSDWVANFGLGVISGKLGDPTESCGEHEDDPVLLAFWATLFLVHLGGPASITAYALEDNALWGRSLALWLIQSIRVLYIVLLAWRNTKLSYLSIVMLLNGFIKCGERTWARYSASIDYRRDKMIPPLDPSIRGKKFVEESTNDSNHQDSDKAPLDLESKATLDIETPQDLLDSFMHLFVSLFKDLVLSYDYLEKHQSYFRQLKPEHAFGMVAVQLGYAYNFFYTKASVFHRDLFINLVAITLVLETGVLICFGFIINEEHHVLKWDQIILTWSLLVGIVLLDSWSSDVVTNPIEQFYLPYVLHSAHSNVDELYEFYVLSSKRTWSNVIPQCNLLTLCLQHNNNSVNFNKLRELLHERTCKPTKELHRYIFNHLINKALLITGGHNLSNYGVNDAIDVRRFKSIKWTKMLEFHQSILTWHIATDICYHGIGGNEDDSKKTISKMISEYMLYILVKQRHMLPVGTGLISFRDTCVETIQVLQQLKMELPSKNVQEACEKLLGVNPDSVRRSRSKSVIFDACRLARSLVIEMERKERWELLEVVWVEILVFAATQCKADQHAQQLRKGGEFLSHVWLLSAHLGVMEQFQVRPAPADPPQHQSMNQENTNERGRSKPEGTVGARDIVEEHIL